MSSEINSAPSLSNSEYAGGLGLPGKFQITGVIGEGGMGVVCSALDVSLGRSVAIKILHERLSDSPSANLRFEREGKTLAGLSHPNIVKIHSAGVTNTGCRFIVTDLLEGQSLASYLADNKMDVATFGSIFLPLVDALKYASEQGVVHRDIKPSNILLCQQDPGRTVPVLIDFGVATRNGDSESCKLTQSQMLIGSPAYMSPEQCRGEAVTYLSDIYSLGCVMYESLSGNPPFTEQSAIETMYRHLADDTVPPLHVKAGGKSGLALVNVIHSCLRKNSTCRIQSYDQIKTHLSAALAELDAEDVFARAEEVATSRRSKWRFICSIIILAGAISLICMKLALHDNKLPGLNGEPIVRATQSGAARDLSSMGASNAPYIVSDENLIRLEHEVQRLQSRIKVADDKGTLSDILSDNMDVLRGEYWRRKRYDDYLLCVDAMIEHARFMSRGVSRCVTLNLEAYRNRMELAENELDASKRAKLIHQAELNLGAAKSLAASFGAVSGKMDVVRAECIFLAGKGKLEEAKRILLSIEPLVARVDKMGDIARLAENLKGDWGDHFFKALFTGLSPVKCVSNSDRICKAEMLVIAIRYVKVDLSAKLDGYQNIRDLLAEISPPLTPVSALYQRYRQVDEAIVHDLEELRRMPQSVSVQ